MSYSQLCCTQFLFLKQKMFKSTCKFQPLLPLLSVSVKRVLDLTQLCGPVKTSILLFSDSASVWWPTIFVSERAHSGYARRGEQTLRYDKPFCQRLAALTTALKVCDVSIQCSWGWVIVLQSINKYEGFTFRKSSTIKIFSDSILELQEYRGQTLAVPSQCCKNRPPAEKVEAKRTLSPYLKVVLCSGASRLLLRCPELDSREVTVDSGDRKSPTKLLDSMLTKRSTLWGYIWLNHREKGGVMLERSVKCSLWWMVVYMPFPTNSI